MPEVSVAKTAAQYSVAEIEPPKVQEGRVALNLGCNQNALPGYVNVDIEDYPGVDVVTNLEFKWPWEDNSVDYIMAVDLVEHLRDKIYTMHEAYRVLKPDGIFHIKVPSTDHRGAWQDPTHVSYWNENSFMYYADEKYEKNSLRPLYPRLITCKYKVKKLATTIPNPFQISWVIATLQASK